MTEIKLPVKFDENVEAITAFANEVKPLQINDKESYQVVYDKLQEAKRTRTAIDKRVKEIKKEAKALIKSNVEDVAEAMLKLLNPTIDDLQSKREAWEKAIEEEKERAYQEKLQPLLEAGLKEVVSGKFSGCSGNIILTKADIVKMDEDEQMKYILQLYECQEEPKEEVIEEKTSPFEGKAFDQPAPSQSTMFDGGSSPEKSPGPNSGKIEPEHGKHRSTLSHVQEIRNYIDEVQNAFDPIELLTKYVDQKIEELKNL